MGPSSGLHLRARLRDGVISGALCLLALPLAANSQPVEPALNPLPPEVRDRIERAILDATNRQRMRRGIQPVAWETDLADIARGYSRQLVGQYRLEHQDASGQGPSERVARHHRRLIGLVGENLAAFSGDWPEDPYDLAEELVQGWMQSPGHRRNLLRQDYTHLGVGLWAEGRELRATQLFTAARIYLTDVFPQSLRQGEDLSLEFEGPSPPEGVRLQPLGSSRDGERRQGPEFQSPHRWTVDVKPGTYRLRFYFRRTAQRFSVIDGPIVQVLPKTP